MASDLMTLARLGSKSLTFAESSASSKLGNDIYCKYYSTSITSSNMSWEHANSLISVGIAISSSNIASKAAVWTSLSYCHVKLSADTSVSSWISAFAMQHPAAGKGNDYSHHLVLYTPLFLCTFEYNFSFWCVVVPNLFLSYGAQCRPLYHQQKWSQEALCQSGKIQRWMIWILEKYKYRITQEQGNCGA